MKKVRLEEITPQNFKECINLKVANGQEKFVASNVMSIAQSKVYPTHLPFAVYADDEMVGFVLCGLDEEEERYYLGRLMIDEKHQGKGYGRAATLAVIEKLKQNENCDEIYLSFAPENTVAENLYKSIGFERTGEFNEGGEIMMRYQVRNER
ncbi:MAG TPA: GNAT family N-acetyltransferase [Pyrinomonadaceae bacterium]|nr:GNAT family N-acetyltransferase [Pyrinomonadaceae bacterium]